MRRGSGLVQGERSSHWLTSAYVAKKSSPLAALLSGGNASDDCTIASKATRRTSLAIVPEMACRFELSEMLQAPDVGAGATMIHVSLANSASGRMCGTAQGYTVFICHGLDLLHNIEITHYFLNIPPSQSRP